MFRKIVAVDPVMLDDAARDELQKLGIQVEYYNDAPNDDGVLIKRIGEADAVLVSYRTRINGAVLAACPGLRYVGMCCSLYSPQSANVDIAAANELGIVVKGVRDYGDEGVPEYVISELVRFLHGFGGRRWREEPYELKGLSTGILGMGTTGHFVGRALRFFGAEVHYYSRTRKPEFEAEQGYFYGPLDEVLEKANILVTCLNRGVVLLGEEQFARFGNGKILVNISIAPGHSVQALAGWLAQGNNYAFGDTPAAIDPEGELVKHPNVFVTAASAGLTKQAAARLGQKVVQNIEQYLADEMV